MLLRLLPRVISGGIAGTLIAVGGVALEPWPQQRRDQLDLNSMRLRAKADMQGRLGAWAAKSARPMVL